MRKIDRLLFGTAGIPLSTKGNTSDGIRQVRKLGLDAMELEFTHGINLSEKAMPEIKEVSSKNNVVLTCHSPYFVNLSSKEAKKANASVQRIITSAKRAFQGGAWSVAFHPGYHMGESPEKVYEKVRAKMKEIAKKLNNDGIKIWIRPETTGKESQFGSLKEICRLSQEIDNVLPCIDFSHIYAREIGKFNLLKDFEEQLKLAEKMLGKEALNNMHAHVSGISYTGKGEKMHMNLINSKFNYKALAKAWKEFNVKGVVISESPNIEGDALLLKRICK